MDDGLSPARDTIEVTFTYERALWRRAMTGWWQSVIPPEPFIKRAITWAVIWFGLLIVTLGIAAFDLTPFYTVAGLVGAGVMVSSFAYLQRTRMGRFWDNVGRHWDRAGPTHVRFDATGLDIRDDVSERRLTWAAIDAVKAVKGGTVFRSGISMLVVPDEALSDGVSPTDFRALITGWRAQ